MSTRDWQEARRELLEEGKQRVGPPPDFETVEALLRGDLPEAEAQRVREVLAFYPELVRVMTAPAPAQEETALSDAEREADFARLRQRLGLTEAPVVAMPRKPPSRVFAIAAAVLILVALGAVALMLWQRQSRPAQTKVLIADADRGTRGPSGVIPVTLHSRTDYHLKPLYRPVRTASGYRFELFAMETAPPRSVWKQDHVVRQSDGSFPVDLSTDDLAPGPYQLVLYGGAERLATYSLRVE